MSLFQELKRRNVFKVAGGSGYIVDTLYSKDYAELMCKQYRALGFFTVDTIHDSRELFPAPDSSMTA